MNDASTTRLELRALGAFEVVLEGTVVPEEVWPRRKAKDLLKVLLTAPGDVFTVDQLIEALLPDADPRRAVSNIRARVSELRSVLGSGSARGSDSPFIQRVGEGYALAMGSDAWLDTTAFERGVAEGLRKADEDDCANAIEVLEGAASLYRGEFLAEDRYAEWAESARSHLKDLHLEALTCMAVCYVKLGRSRDALSCCRRVLAIDPCRESVARQLMLLLSDAGQHAQAVRTHRRLVESLREELGVEPSEETLSLYRELSQAEPVRGGRFDPRRLAVIPFVNVGSDPDNDILADGVTEELIYALSRISGLEVIAQTTVLKYKGARKSVAEIGQELRVGTVLEGSAQRVKDRARILVQLIDVESEAHLWAEQYDRRIRDLLTMQGDIARRVARALEVRLLTKEETAIRREDAVVAEARDAYVRGRFFLAKRTDEAYSKA
ncbi:winged helix-turn-helix domain-containing protein, partial [Candidatus Bipolaricaulota bacterium]|nr:winged helix-turn-helix domain-containing protein [Candidatus Bipolaricaulota bacterium]